MRRPAAIGGPDGPAVLGVAIGVGPARGQHRLDGQDQPRLQPHATAWTTFVRQMRILVHRAPDAMPTMVLGQPIPGRAADHAHSVRDVPQLPTGLGRFDPGPQRPFGRGDQLQIARIRRPDHETDRGIAVPAVDVSPAVDAHQIAVGQPVTVRDAMHDRVVDAGTNHPRIRHRGEPRVIPEKRRLRPTVRDHLRRNLIQLPQADPHRSRSLHRVQRPRHHPPGLTHHRKLNIRLDLNHADNYTGIPIHVREGHLEELRVPQGGLHGLRPLA